MKVTRPDLLFEVPDPFGNCFFYKAVLVVTSLHPSASFLKYFHFAFGVHFQTCVSQSPSDFFYKAGKFGIFAQSGICLDHQVCWFSIKFKEDSQSVCNPYSSVVNFRNREYIIQHVVLIIY